MCQGRFKSGASDAFFTTLKPYTLNGRLWAMYNLQLCSYDLPCILCVLLLMAL